MSTGLQVDDADQTRTGLSRRRGVARINRLTIARLKTARLLPRGGSVAPAFIASVDKPAGRRVIRHNGRVCRLAGWAVSTTGRPVTVIARRDGRVVGEQPVDQLRPDVAAVLAPGLAADPRCGFSLYVDLPPLTGPPITVSLEYTDGEHVSKPTRFTVVPEPDLLNLDTYEGASPAKNDLAARYLSGRGVELGALHQPLPVDPARATVEYVDRLTRAQALATFPELVPHADQFVEPTFLIDFATSDLSELRPHGFDFIIANDVIEHLPNPLKLLRDMYDAIKPGALMFLSAPDRDYTFDAQRALTTNRHLWREYKRGTTEPSRAHVREYVRSTTPQVLSFTRQQRKVIYEDHRRRSIHVHVWDQASFDAFLTWALRRLDLRLEIVERLPSRAAFGCMVYVLRKLPA